MVLHYQWSIKAEKFHIVEIDAVVVCLLLQRWDLKITIMELIKLKKKQFIKVKTKIILRK